MTPVALADLHSIAMAHATPWGASDFRGLLSEPSVFLETTNPPAARGPLSGFVLGRSVVDEAELLTLVVDPARRREGLGRELLRRFETAAAGRGAVTAFLEVAADNSTALALYRNAGWRQVGQRPGYYARHAAEPADALILRKTLKTP